MSRSVQRSAVFAVCLLVWSPAASAKLCGDDVDGQDVACECGDVLVSDVVLADDPVAARVCQGDGLRIRAATQTAITIDLAGRTLRGSGRGDGLLIIYGGDGGARITSSRGAARVEAFGDGISAPGIHRLSSLENVIVSDVERDGIRVRGPAYTIRHTKVVGAGRDGFSLAGRGYRVAASESSGSGRHGFLVMGHGGNFENDTRALDSGGFGFQVAGGGHHLIGCRALRSAKNGIELVASDVTVESCAAEDNLGGGIDGHGMRLSLSNNRARGNAEHGINVRGGVTDGGGNGAAGNGLAPGGTWVQCLLAGTPCR